jgi:hypothetical protein
MAELVAFVAFVVALAVIEGWYIAHHETTISEHVTTAVFSWRPAAALVGFGIGWLTCHFLS